VIVWDKYGMSLEKHVEDKINGHPREMDDFSFLASPSLSGEVARAPRDQGCKGGHGFGMQECQKLVTKDREVTIAMQKFLTQVAQGFAAYRSIVHTCAENYGQAGQLTADEINRRSTYDPRSNLPDFAPEFQPPPPTR
jgi:hypothetical protein